MADSFTLPLRPVVEKSDRPDTLPVEIAQINEQWGNFRNVNEEVLLSKLAEEEEYGGPVDSEENDDKKDMYTTCEPNPKIIESSYAPSYVFNRNSHSWTWTKLLWTLCFGILANGP